jgi:hypothetical protein
MIAATLAAIPQADPIALPAPPLLLEALLILMFFLHMLPMNFVLGGSIIGTVARFRAKTHDDSRMLAAWIGKMMPPTVSFAVSFGVAALLFLQVLYGRLFFASSIVLGWFWFGVVPILIVAYYGTYVIGGRGDRSGRSTVALASLVALLFMAIAFIYSNNMTLALRPETIRALHRSGDAAMHLNLGDPTLIPRYLHMLLGAIAVSGMVVSVLGRHAAKDDERHGTWAMRHGAIWFVMPTVFNFLVGLWWLGTLPREVILRFAGKSVLALVSLSVGSLLGLVACIAMVMAMNSPQPKKFVGAGLWSLLGCLFLMVIARDEVRKGMLGIAGFEQPTWVAPQWGVIAIFGVLLVAGVATTIWMISLLARKPEGEGVGGKAA